MKFVTGIIYRFIVKPILFLFPADDVHHLFLRVGKILGKFRPIRALTKALWGYENKVLNQVVSGMYFKNPIGLSAGFDYNADLVNILPSVGFGFHTIGTLTLEAYEGNPAPMLGRLPKSRALLVNKGFKNEGITKVLSSLNPKDGRAVRGVSVGVTNKAYDTYEQMLENLISGFEQADKCPHFDYFELNISCPNLRNVKLLTERLAEPGGLREALTRLAQISLSRPVFIKMPLERTEEGLHSLIEVAKDFSFVRGLILSNLAKDRANPHFHPDEISCAGAGNFSGKPLEEKANELLKFAYKNYSDRFILIGVGGVFNAQDAYKKFRSGATLVQLITGMVYQGPQVIGEINQGLAKLLAKDGFSNISEAIGADVRG
jgi:dihydroorotate dehydrogenase subfamily 2